MKRIFLFLLCWAIVIVTTALAAEVKEIELNDGSVITGEIIALNNGVYTIKTAAMGTLMIEDSKVRAIRPRGSSASSAGSSGQSTEITNLQQKMLTDQEVLDMLQALSTDPEFQKILEDPEIMKAVNANDAAALMNNPKFMRLMQNPSVKNIQRKIE